MGGTEGHKGARTEKKVVKGLKDPTKSPSKKKKKKKKRKKKSRSLKRPSRCEKGLKEREGKRTFRVNKKGGANPGQGWKKTGTDWDTIIEAGPR